MFKPLIPPCQCGMYLDPRDSSCNACGKENEHQDMNYDKKKKGKDRMCFACGNVFNPSLTGLCPFCGSDNVCSHSEDEEIQEDCERRER